MNASVYYKVSILGGSFSNGVNCTLNATRLVKEWWIFLHYGQLAHYLYPSLWTRHFVGIEDNATQTIASIDNLTSHLLVAANFCY
jgi:hypothetical protein